ncbi:hypothetical protein QBC34DRAFT_150775 [Podospora aff. communis PSN243]|uniref:Prion-inhibition and propagation HeLo domain-containing protein n=1 Tax=Podospora aff. communis PSN243 TaxID=3040156 RepID=A0AAV9GDQ4_9PEZI|nr:hypothetical protein QBC34DRAFT_150775 [Podospora aff. communis PSN243]
MADPASIILGIAPLCVAAFKGFKKTRSTLRTIRHGSHELSRLKGKYDIQSELFNDECEYVLRDMLDAETAANMMDDFSEALWSSKTLEPKFRAYLGTKYDRFKSTVEDISKVNNHLRDAIEKWAEHLERGEQARAGLSMASKSSKFKEDLENLSDLNSLLRTLRKRAKETKMARGQRKTLPQSILQVRRAALSLHALLSHHWSCRDPSHIQHVFRLLFDVDVGEVVRLRGIFQTESGVEDSRNMSMLQIASRDVRWVESSASESTAAERKPKHPRLQRRRDPLTAKDAISPKTLAGVRLPGPLIATSVLDPLDLRFCQDLCARFRVCGYGTGGDGRPVPPGYYMVDDAYRHKFELCPNSPFLATTSNYETLSDTVGQGSGQVATVVDQLRIALSLVRATLQFWSTPWWRTYWSLRDIGVIRKRKVPVLSDTVRSIHVNVDLRGCGQTESAKTTAEPAIATGALTNQDVDRATLTFGIRNLNLYCLGVALLQIGRWGIVQMDDVESIRRLAALPSHLGPKYREITERCLECDFGVGKNIRDIKLQAAIYDSVARPLESMIQALSLNDEQGSQSEF